VSPNFDSDPKGFDAQRQLRLATYIAKKHLYRSA
jgi:hypothetical protein